MEENNRPPEEEAPAAPSSEEATAAPEGEVSKEAPLAAETAPETAETVETAEPTETAETVETVEPTEPEAASEAAAKAPKESAWRRLKNRTDAFFGVTAAGSNFKTEIIAGLTTFMAMVYILMVNAEFFSADFVGLSYGAAYIATAIGAVTGTMLMALLAKMPLAQASGMGINAFIVYSIIGAVPGMTFANSMIFVLLDGVVFLILTATGLRKKIFEAIPEAVRHAIPVGIGLFIAFIGFQNARVIVGDGSTLVRFTDAFNVLATDETGASVWSYGAMLSPLICLLGVAAIAVMSKKNIRGAILWGIVGTSVLYFALAAIGCAWGDAVCVEFFKNITIANPFAAFGDWGREAVGQVFINGFNFSGYLSVEGQNAGTLVLVLFTSALSLCTIDMFDTIGTLYGACAKGGLLDENGTPVRMEKMMLSDAIATCAGAVAGTSTVTTFVESSSGVAAGGKTGFTALVTAVLFFLAMFLSPVAQLIPSAATAAALIWVGVLMMTSIKNIRWEDTAEAIIAFLTFIVMILGYSIAKGIGIGILAYILVMLATGKGKKIRPATWVIGVLFLAMFILT